MKRPLNKGRRNFLYAKSHDHLWPSLERFLAMNLRMVGFLHQFKTPLHVIQSQTELLLEDSKLSPDVRRSLHLIHQNAGRLAIETRTMMDSARGSRSNMEPALLGPILDSICQAAETDCRKKNIRMEEDLQPVAPIHMDRIALEGALHNLVNNAIEAMAGGGHLKVRSFEVHAPHRVAVEITDTGKGMDQAAFRKVLKSPFQSTKSEGTGLGLFISRHI